MGDEQASDKHAQLRHLAHPARTWAFIALSTAVAVMAFGLGTLVRSPDSSVLNARNQTLPVFTAVESRVVTSDVRIQGEVVGSTAIPVFAELPEGASRAVVTSISVESSAMITNATLLGTVSDRPIFVFSLKVPLFRDVRRSDRGSDVSSLQNALGVPASGVMDVTTLRAVRDLYARVELVPPGGTGDETFVRLAEFVSLPASGEPVTLRAIASVGTLLDPSTPFAELGVGRSFVAVRASVSEASRIVEGGEAVVQSTGGTSVIGTVTAIGEFQPNGTDDGRPPGRDVRVDLPDDNTLASGAAVTALFGTEAEAETAVPTLAVRSDASGNYVLRRSSGGGTERARITVIGNADGWTALNSSDLQVGDEVLVSP